MSNRRVAQILTALGFCLMAMFSQTLPPVDKPSAEYIRLGGRLVAIERRSSAAASNTATVTISSVPPGRQIVIDNETTARVTPFDVSWDKNSTGHTLKIATPTQPSAPGQPPSRFVFSRWDDGTALTTRPITVPNSDTATFTATFDQQFELIMNTNGLGRDVSATLSPTSGWYAPTPPITLGVTSPAGYTFTGWTGDGYTGTNTAALFNIVKQTTQTANFRLAGAVTVTITVTSTPPGLTFNRKVGSSSAPAITFATPSTFSMTAGDYLEINTPATQTLATGNYDYSFWADSSNPSATPPGPNSPLIVRPGTDTTYNAVYRNASIPADFQLDVGAIVYQGTADVVKYPRTPLTLSGTSVLAPQNVAWSLEALDGLALAGRVESAGPGSGLPQGTGVYYPPGSSASGANTGVWNITQTRRLRINASYGSSGVVKSADLTLLPGENAPPAMEPGITRLSGDGTATPTIQATAGDPNGPSDLQFVQMLLRQTASPLEFPTIGQYSIGSRTLSQSLTSNEPCHYVIDYPYRLLLMPQPSGPVSVASLDQIGSLGNGNCSIAPSAMETWTFDKYLTIRYPLVFNTSTFSGTKPAFFRAHDASFASSWMYAGNLSIPGPLQITIIPPETQPMKVTTTADSATFSWTTTDSRTTTSIVEYWRITPSGQVVTSAQTQSSSHSITVPNLLPGTTYNYRVSTNEVGTSESVSYLGTFTTQGSIPTFTTRQVNLGGTADGDWEASSGCNGGSPTNALRTFTAPNIYKTQLFGMTNCQYAVPDGKPYLVTLKFAEIFYPQTSPGNRRFNVSINGVQVLTNFNVYEAAGNLVDKPVDRTFAITAQRGMIDVQFTSIQDNPIINAVQITPASPSAVRRINIGGPSLTTSDGKVWEADPAGAVACPSVACTTNTAVPEPYRSQRYGNMTLSYSGFPAGAYDVTLKFAETYYGTVGAAGGRRIDATVNGSNFLKSFNPAAAAGAVNTPVDRTFQVFVDTGTIQIVLSSAGDAAIVNAVEIQPSRFWARRINAGMTGLGTHSITDTDAGKFWGPDEYYVGGSSLGDTSTQNPASTQRYFAASGGGYRFPVPPGTYSVRLRFTEIYYPCPASSRAFNVKINGTLVLGNFNPSLANPCTTVERAFLVPVDQSSLIDVKFESVTGDAPIVSAIEVESVSASAYPALSLNISPGTVTGSQGATGTLTLGSPAPGGAVVQLLTSDSSAASVPTSATFQAGATSTTFPIATAGQAVQKVAAITANYEGVLATYPITVNPASASPVITLNPASLTFSSSGSNPPSQSFAITNTGGGTLNWSASGLPSWLSFNPTSGTAPTTVTANVSVAGLSPATYTANVTISNGATSATLPVSLSVNAAGGTLIFREDFEGANPVVGGEYTFVADTPGIRTELYPAGYYSIASNPNDVHDAFCTIADHSEPGTKMMVVNGKGFAAGQTFTTAWERSVPLTQGTNYRFSAWVTSAYYASPAQIQLRADGLNVGAVVIAPSACAPWIQVQGTFQAQGPNATLRILDLNSSGDGNDFALDDIELSVVTAAPTISATPASVALSAIQGASTPVTQAVTLTNSGNLAWTAASNQSWLSVTPTSGSAGASLTISANPTGLAASATPYSGTITVTASGAGNSPLSIPVAFTINAPASPTISLSPASLAFTATQGGNPSPASQTVTVSNSGGGTLTWSAAFVGTAPSWLTLTPSASSLTATVNSTSLAASAVPYTATIAITATGATNTPQNITVSLNVNTSGGISTPLVGWWKFDEAPGTTVLDSSTTSPPSNGTIAGTTYTRVPGKFGSALSLGAASYVDLLNPPALRNFTAPSSVSVSAWVKSTSANGWRSVVAWDSGSGDYYRLNFNAGGSLPARGAAFNVLTAAGNREIIYNVNITDGNWHLLTGTYNGATRVLSIYVDGALGNSTVLPAGEIMQIGGTGDQKVYIGGQKDNSSPPVWEYLDATVDDVRIYNGALTAAEVSTLFTGGGGGSAPAAPTGLTATRGNGQLTLNWAVSSGATSYNVKRATASGGPYTTVATGVTGAPYTNTGLTNGTSYYYVVTAVNSSGESTNSAEASNAPFPPIKDDFESPPPFGFTSGYTYAAPNGTNTLLNEGLFSVYTNPNGLHGAFCSYGDHTSGAGKMMVLNGSSTRTPVWSRNVTGLAVNQTYTLSLWVASAYHLNLAQLQFKVNGTLVTPSITAPSIPAGCPTAIANPWQNLQVTFPATATSATIEIVDLTNATQGDDFAVDDIEVK